MKHGKTEREQAEQALGESEEIPGTVISHAPVVLFAVDARGVFTLFEGDGLGALGLRPDDVVGRSAFEVCQDVPQIAENIRRVLAGEVFTAAVEMAGVAFEAHYAPLRDHDGTIRGAIGVATDLTKGKRAEEALRASEAKYRQIFENVRDIYYRTEATGEIIEISPSVESYGYSREQMIGTSVLEVYEDPEERSALVKAILERGEVTDYELRLKTGDGGVIDTSLSARLLRGPHGVPVGFEGFIRDISARKRAEEALREQARRDSLTGVLNHGAIMDELRALTSHSGHESSFALAMVDVNGLKATNDTFGHQVGDAVLVTVAQAVSRDSTLVGRYGGDEFLAVLPGADHAAAERYRDQLLGALADVSLRDPHTAANVPVLVSVGLAAYPAEAARIEELIDVADRGMYAAKRQRPVASVGGALPQLSSDDIAAKMVGEIVPLLTSRGDLNDKLRSVAHRLSVGAGYDGVNFSVFAALGRPPLASNTYAQAPDDLVEAWNREQRYDESGAHPIRLALESGRRPIIIDDACRDERLRQPERELLEAAGFRSALVAPMIWQSQVVGLLGVASKRAAAFAPHDAQFLMAVAAPVTAIVRMATLVEALQSATDRLAATRTETVMMLAAAAEAHDRATGLHLQNVRTLAEKLARALGHDEEYSRELGLAAVLHDIGKVRVPEVVLSTVGELSDSEWDLLKQHTVWGDEFLRGRPGFEQAATIARSHHERWDGNGYPDGLAGEAIPEAAAIVAVADSFDAITSDRPYRAGRSIAAALGEIAACSGKQFSPKVADAIVRLHEGKVPHGGPTDAAHRKAAA